MIKWAWAVVLLGGAQGSEDLRTQALQTLRKATEFYTLKVATHGGYVYYYSEDLQARWGEGKATSDQIWVQPPGTPTVGMAYLRAFEATGDELYLDAARAAAGALMKGQLESGGWTNHVNFKPENTPVRKGKKLPVHRYRKGSGGTWNSSSLDDGQTQSALLFLTRMDRALQFKDPEIHEAVQYGLEALLKAQFPNGAFPQGWKGPVEAQPVVKADYPDYDWRMEGKIPNYWDMYTLNDGNAPFIAHTLFEAFQVYKDARFMAALRKLGDFLILAQMPDPQPAWCQQYNYAMQPIWARKFEPPAIVGRESEDVMEALLLIHRQTGDAKYLEPVGRALDYLQACILPDGKLARYYELQTNKPLYMTSKYQLTYDDSDLPTHYGFKNDHRLGSIRQALEDARQGKPVPAPGAAEQERKVREIIAALDGQGRWVSVYQGERQAAPTGLRNGDRFISSETFSLNVETLSGYLTIAK